MTHTYMRGFHIFLSLVKTPATLPQIVISDLSTKRTVLKKLEALLDVGVINEADGVYYSLISFRDYLDKLKEETERDPSLRLWFKKLVLKRIAVASKINPKTGRVISPARLAKYTAILEEFEAGVSMAVLADKLEARVNGA